jgi:hypothetical protein
MRGPAGITETIPQAGSLLTLLSSVQDLFHIGSFASCVIEFMDIRATRQNSDGVVRQTCFVQWLYQLPRISFRRKNSNHLVHRILQRILIVVIGRPFHSVNSKFINHPRLSAIGYSEPPAGSEGRTGSGAFGGTGSGGRGGSGIGSLGRGIGNGSPGIGRIGTSGGVFGGFSCSSRSLPRFVIFVPFCSRSFAILATSIFRLPASRLNFTDSSFSAIGYRLFAKRAVARFAPLQRVASFQLFVVGWRMIFQLVSQ